MMMVMLMMMLTLMMMMMRMLDALMRCDAMRSGSMMMINDAMRCDATRCNDHDADDDDNYADNYDDADGSTEQRKGATPCSLIRVPTKKGLRLHSTQRGVVHEGISPHRPNG